MALLNNKITTSLVGDALGSSSRDVGTLCAHQNINKWSRWKPIRLNKVSGITESELQNANCGLLVYEATTDYKLLIPSPLMWFYSKPRGGSFNEPFRLGDFRNYNHNGTPPVTSMPASTITVNKAINGLLTMQPVYRTKNTTPINDPSIIRIDDLNTSIGNLYYAVVFEWLNQVYIKTAPQSVSEYGNTVTFNFNNEYPLNNMSPQSLDFYSVLCDTRITNLTLLDNITPAVLFRPLPIGDNDNNVSKIILRDESGLSFRPTKVSANDSVFAEWGPFIDIPYYPSMGTLVANKGLQFKVRVENYTNQNITIPLQGWEMNANPTYWGANTNYFSFSLVNPDTGGVYTQAPVVPANNGVIEVGFRVQNILDRDGTDIVAVDTKKTETVSIRFRNGIYEGNTSVHVTSME